MTLTIAVSFFFNDTPTTEIYTLSLHDALPICVRQPLPAGPRADPGAALPRVRAVVRHRAHRRLAHPLSDGGRGLRPRSEEHTSELQSQSNLVCRLLLEKKNTPTSRRQRRSG